jgi:selenocysteine lyase/cysteine desulfurase
MDAAMGETPIFDQAEYPRAKTPGYLNTAGMGLVSRSVLRRFQAQAEQIALGGTQAYFDVYDEVMVGPRRAAARLFHAPVGQVAIINSVSEIMSQVACALQPNCKRNVVMIDIDHPSPTYPWLRLAQETQLEVRFVQARGKDATVIQEELEALVDHDTAAVSVSHVNWNTGLRLDLVRLGQVAHAHDALLMVDATHSAGVLELDAPALGVDLIATGAFKWLCGFSGIGACYVAPELSERLVPVLLGSRSSDPKPPFAAMDATRFDLPLDARRWEYGSSAHVLRLAFAQAVGGVLDIGLERITAHDQSLAARLAEGLAERGFEVLTPWAASARAAIVSARHPRLDSGRLCAALEAAGVIASLRLDAVRFAPHGYNQRQDIEAALDAVDDIVRRGMASRDG